MFSNIRHSIYFDYSIYIKLLKRVNEAFNILKGRKKKLCSSMRSHYAVVIKKSARIFSKCTLLRAQRSVIRIPRSLLISAPTHTYRYTRRGTSQTNIILIFVAGSNEYDLSAPFPLATCIHSRFITATGERAVKGAS